MYSTVTINLDHGFATEEAAIAPAPAATSVVLGTSPARGKPAAKPASAAPIVAKPWSKFIVTVEYIELVAANVAESPDAARPST